MIKTLQWSQSIRNNEEKMPSVPHAQAGAITGRECGYTIDILVVQNECLLVSFIGFDVEIDHRVISILLQRKKGLVQHITLRHPCRWPNYAQWQ